MRLETPARGMSAPSPVRSVRVLCALTISLLLALAGELRAEEWFVPHETNPVAFGTLRLHPPAAEPPGAGWSLVWTTTYFNAWRTSWHGKTIHRELGRDHAPLSHSELLLLENRGPSDEIFFVDLEGWRSDLTASRRVGAGTISIDLPWIAIGTPRWDGLGERAHQAGGGGRIRELFPRGQILFYVRNAEHRAEAREELRRVSVGNVSVSYARPLPTRSARFQHEAVVSAQLPTAPVETLAGGGAWDVGAGWFATLHGARSTALFGVAYTRVDPSATLLGFPRRDTRQFVAAWQRPVREGLVLTPTLRVDTSPLASYRGEPGGTNVMLHLAATTRVGNSAVTWGFGENVPQFGLGSDWTFDVQISRWR